MSSPHPHPNQHHHQRPSSPKHPSPSLQPQQLYQKQASTPSQPISSSLAASGPRRTSNAPRPRSLVGPADTHPSKKSQLSRRYRIAILISVIAVLLIGLIVGLSIFFTKKASTGGSSRPYNGVGNGTYVGNFSTPKRYPYLSTPKTTVLCRPQHNLCPCRNIGEYRLARGDGGSSGAVAIHLALMRDSSKVLMMDRWDVYKTEATLPNGNPAWAVEYDYTTDTYRPLTLVSNLFCGGGMLLPDQRVMVIGGSENFTDLGGIEDGMKSIRLFAPSGSPGNFGDAPLVDDPSNTKLQLKQTMVPSGRHAPEGRTLVIGGSIVGVAFTAPANNTGHMEILPPVSTSQTPPTLIPLQFLWDTLPANLYPTAALLPSGRIFISAADRAQS
ncbi:glyoxal oxidase N-terminus-domain-containing protein [Chytridium lagenaria]|nr:glyoxal oxidase N-terminus-domain-containing protein [Chytridium lagenaria]